MSTVIHKLVKIKGEYPEFTADIRCSDKSRNYKRMTFSILDEKVTCKRCLKKLKERKK